MDDTQDQISTLREDEAVELDPTDNFSEDAPEVAVEDESPINNIMDGSSQADEFLDLENLIKNYLTRIDSLKQELKKQNDLFKDSFESDAVYKEHEDRAKEAARLRAETKQQILKQPALASLSEKIAEIKNEIKELQETLSDYLLQYQKMTGFSQIETDQGETLIIVNSAKLVKGSSRNK
jgi:predicted RNase H-like nuclease (RuvC/YqgF family)